MKNKQVERRRRLAKQYHQNKRGTPFVDGIMVWLQYEHLMEGGLSWWNGVELILGEIRISVFWQHPRHEYRERIEEKAANIAVEVSQADKNINWLEEAETQRKRLWKEASFTIHPSINVNVFEEARGVDIVAPIEVRNADDMHKLVDLVQRLLKQETTLDIEFPRYVYGREQWINEGILDIKYYPG
ncbi:hypothetical protein [Methylobacillus glycogenes]|uniref:hypothetical protein n=1 Tax=Methylobacillus glycogenes TaxID=406 RepID=UPI0004704282|nr:hypothetical protein [Methylobacillus glycogenes]